MRLTRVKRVFCALVPRTCVWHPRRAAAMQGAGRALFEGRARREDVLAFYAWIECGVRSDLPRMLTAVWTRKTRRP